MFTNKLSKALVALLSVAFASHVAYTFYSKKKKTKRTEINEVIMFSEDHNNPKKKSKFSSYKLTKSMDRLLYYLNYPQQSIDICMYVMTHTDVMNAILKLHIRGVKIRVIIDADMAFSNGSTSKRLEKHGIPVRWMKSSNLMHHKFCVIDTRFEDANCTPIIIVGSLNWTKQGFNGNWEDVVITSQEDLVRAYKKEFERLWLLFKPIVDLS